MSRATWKGFLRLSLVSCPVYLSPASTRAKSISLHQVWRPREQPGQRTWGREGEDEDRLEPARGRRQPVPAVDEPADYGTATRIALRPHDPYTGEEIERDEVVRGYEYERGQFVTFTPDELKALDVESSKIIDLTKFVPRADVDPIYFNTPYYVFPDGPIATEAFRVIGAAMAEAGMAGIGRVTLSRRERPVLVEPRGAGMVLITLRAADEIRAAEFGDVESEVDADMVAIAEAIIKRRTGSFDPTMFRDRYQEALRELVEAKIKGLPVKPKPVATPPRVLDLMAALKQGLAEETAAEKVSATAPKTRRARAAADRRQRSLLLPVSGGGRKKPKPVEAPIQARRRCTVR